MMISLTPNLKIGAEHNHGTKNWLAFAPLHSLYSPRPLRLQPGRTVFFVTQKKGPYSGKNGRRLFHCGTDLRQSLFGNLLDRHRIDEQAIHDRR